MKSRNKEGSQGSGRDESNDGNWDRVAQASWESFPASDSPSWIGQHTDGPVAGAPHHLRAAGTEVTFQDDSFVIDVALLAKLLDISIPDVQRLMRDGRITSVCEKGIDDHQGQYRLTFVHGTRRAYVNVDAGGRVLTRSVTYRA